jgi:multiple sugar transport system permease protein
MQNPNLGQQARSRIGKLSIHALLIIITAVFMLPLYWMVVTSLKDNSQVIASPPVWFPNPILWKNYPDALTFLPFGQFFVNTFVIAFFVIVGDLISCSWIAYGFARLRFPGRDLLFFILVSTMMIPFAVRLIPLFLIFKNLGWVNTYLPLIVPAFFGTPFFIFLMRQFFRSIPQDLVDAARIDGATEIRIWWNIMLPLSKPALITVAILAFQGVWNDFLAPLVFLNDQSKWTVALGINALLSPSGQSVELWNMLMAVSTAAILPMLVIFIFGQRYFVEGITLTGMKG